MSNVFAVVGQHRADPDRLLLVGDDGRHYAFDCGAPEAPPAPTAPNPTDWKLDEPAAEQAAAYLPGSDSPSEGWV